MELGELTWLPKLASLNALILKIKIRISYYYTYQVNITSQIISLYKIQLMMKMGIYTKLLTGLLMITISICSLLGFYSTAFHFHNAETCRKLHIKKGGHEGFDANAFSERVADVLERMESLQKKIKKDENIQEKFNRLDFKNYLQNEVIEPLYSTHTTLRQIRLPKLDGIRNTGFKEEPLINLFAREEIRTYITPKENKRGKMNLYGTERVYNTIGHACVIVKKGLEDYMSYNNGGNCKDDWNLAQKLMLQGCDPLPRRRCITRGPKLCPTPFPANESLWKVPEDRNVRWNNYQCKSFKCLGVDFEMEKEKLKWVTKSSLSVDFLISDVLAIKLGEVRIGLDYSVDMGTFGARMKEQNVTVISTALNLGAPFSEMIALRGLLHLYITPNQWLPFFDNTMDLIHSAGFLDGWVDLVLLEFVLFDWDRVLRPGGLLWVDRFFCNRNQLNEYMNMFLKFQYKRHKWVVAAKSKDEVYLSVLLEKPRR